MTDSDLKRTSREIVRSLLAMSPDNREEALEGLCRSRNVPPAHVRRLLTELVSGDTDSSWRGTSTTRAPTASFQPGDIIAGRYQVEALLGKGGMGKVYRVRDLDLSVFVALKTILVRAGAQREQIARLKREALLARSVTHPHVCRVYDVGRDGEGEDAVWFLTMELIHGTTLDGRLRQRGPMTEVEVLPIIVQMAAGLEAAHASGVIHRDFKTANVMLVPSTERERVVITDFGIAREVADADGTIGMETPWITTAGIVGTPAYMAPEQILGAPIGPQTDLYAFGLVIFEMLTGRLPFSGATPMELAMKRITGPPISVRDLRPDLPDRWEAVIAKCLARDPADRFEAAHEIVDALVASAEAASVEGVMASTAEVANLDAVESAGSVGGEGTPSPPLRRAAEKPVPSNLPNQISRFVGRTDTLAVAIELLSKERLVTLTGSGGVGKTRLAVETARSRLREYSDGVWLVELASLADPELVPQSVATVLGLKEQSQAALVEVLIEHLRSRRVLLILDNADHLLAACADLSRSLLRACTELSILVTSREALRIAGETVCQVPNLDLPGVHAGTPEDLEGIESAALFIDRARSAHPGFAVTPDVVPAIAEICRRLDGIPLALELAAARVRAMPVDLIAGHLDHRFRLLTGGGRAELPHHQTLRALIDWSYQQLDEGEQAVLRSLSCFAGGWTLDAAEAVCATGEVDVLDVLDLLSRLVDKSLVEVDRSDRTRGAIRYRLLETVRQYAWENLEEAGRLAEASRAHNDFFVALAERARDSLLGPDQERWSAILESELDNLRSVFATSKSETGWLEDGLRLAGALAPFWHLHGYWSEGRQHCEEILKLAGPIRTANRARALDAAGQLATAQGDYDRAEVHLAEARSIFEELGDRGGAAWAKVAMGDLALHRRDLGMARGLFETELGVFQDLGDRRGVAVSLRNLGVIAVARGNLDEARARYEESLETERALGNKLGIANVLNNLGRVAREQRDLESAHRHYSESLSLQRGLGNRFGVAVALNNLGVVADGRGILTDARRFYEESLTLLRDLGHRSGVGQVLHNLGDVAHAQGQFEAARGFYCDAVDVRLALGDRSGATGSLFGLCALALHSGQWRRAAVLFGTVEGQRSATGHALTEEEREETTRIDTALRAGMDPLDREASHLAGAKMELAEAARWGLGDSNAT